MDQPGDRNKGKRRSGFTTDLSLDGSKPGGDRLRPRFRSVLLNLLVIIVPIVVMILVDFALIVERFSYQRQIDELSNRQRQTSYSQVNLLTDPVAKGDREKVKLVLAAIIADPFFTGAKVKQADGTTLVAIGQDVNKGDPQLRFVQDILEATGGPPRKVGELITLATPRLIFKSLHQQREQLIALAVIMLMTITGAVYIAYRLVVGRPLDQLVQAIRSRDHRETGAPLVTPSVECSGRDEIAEMIADFNDAEKERADYHWKLIEAKLTLEEKVRERTDALSHALAQAKSANESKASFLANMSHELRTPLNAIIGFAEVIQHTHAEDEELATTHEHAVIIADSGRHLLDLLNTVLDYSKTQSGKMKLDETEFDVVEVVESAARTFSQAVKDKNIDMTTIEASGNLPIMSGDLRKITQILLNLFSNAVKFTDDGGKIAALISGDDKGLSVAISDSGSGLSPEELDVVMRPFEQATNADSSIGSGTGLGLPLSRDLAEMHGGTLNIDSVKGEGTTVTLWLPASRFVPGGNADRGESAA
ncbi:MAG: ATP-binding protein [Hyphomicrobiales bacterium]|nr:ATP-binding protein [Hyphomicrobiales bacterium]